jgi:Ca-activated chloride channel family protein
MAHMRKPVIYTFLLFSLIAVTSTSEAQKQKPATVANEEDEVVRVNTTLVTLPVSVMDRNGRFIPDLKQDQFRLFEDDVEQKIAFFENAEQPFTLALLLDVSDSTAAKLAQIKDAAAAFVDELREDDRILVMTFDKRITILCEVTGDRRVLDAAISRAQTGGGTSLYSAIDEIIKRFKRIHGRKAIVLFTDGVDTTSRDATYESTLRTAEELDALVYAIQYNTYDDVMKPQRTSLEAGQIGGTMVTSKGEPLSVAYKRAERYLRLMPDKTGGRFFYAATLDYLKEIFARIAAELREQYSLGYYPSNRSLTKAKRELKVRVSLPNVAIRTRRSYIYAPPAR